MFTEKLQLYTNKALQQLFEVLTVKVLQAHIVRLGLVFLDLWQLVALTYNRTAINVLFGFDTPEYVYMPFISILAVIALGSLATLSRKYTLVFLGFNVVEFILLTTAAALYSVEKPPLFAVGLFAFIALVSIGAFLRVLILDIKLSHE